MGVEERSSCTRYMPERCETNANEGCYERVKKTLKKLPESEQTVIVLYYLGQMTTQEIGKTLGVSVKTITRRLQRARELLQDDKVRLIQEVLGNVQISESLGRDIMRQVADIKSKSLSVRKRFVFISLTIVAIAIIGAFVFKLLW